LLRKVLNASVNNEVYSEEVRQKLAKRPLFDCYDAFKALDKDNNGYISINEFRDLLAEHGQFPANKDLLNLMKRYDKNHDGKVSYSEFVQELTPKSPQKI
jgi:Ca2+-binding EF-hand superfamily protein